MLQLEYLAELVEKHRAETHARVKEFTVQGHPFQFNSHPAIMGVINLSADSWYRESVCLSAEAAVHRGMVLHAQGAAVIDIGAESTLANAEIAESDIQNSKLLPVVQRLQSAGILVSVETYQPAVAQACLEAGAGILNLTGNSDVEEIYSMVAKHDAAVIICHVQGKNVRKVRDFKLSDDPIPVMRAYFERQIEMARHLGVEKIFIDPGLGFYYRNLQDSALRVQHQMKTFLNTFRLRSLGYPICHALPHAFEYFGDEVRTAESFFAVLASLGKTDLFRTHEVPKVRSVIDTMSAFQ
jgi:dihydropteroate synthase